MRFFVVQPYGRHRGRESTVVYEAKTAAEAFGEIELQPSSGATAENKDRHVAQRE